MEKLKYAYLYGADAAYIGIRNFSLRQKADNFHEDEHLELARLKGNRKLFGALNIFYHEKDISNLKDNLEYLALYPLDVTFLSEYALVKHAQGDIDAAVRAFASVLILEYRSQAR